MPHTPIKALNEGDAVKQFFSVRQAKSGATKAGKPFLSLTLGDHRGALPAKVWSEVLSKCPGPFKAGDIVGVHGQVGVFEGERQLTVKYIKTLEVLEARGSQLLKEFDPDLLYLSTPYDREELWRELLDLAAGHIDPPLQDLVLCLLEKHQEAFKSWPGAQMYHHAYVGGLLEHTVMVARAVLAALTVYPQLHRSLALAGAILHDLGKIKELANPVAPDITVDGQLLGHIALGWDMVRDEARILEFPDANLLRQLEHIILSHHGELEFGSPVVPKTPEAFLVHYLDDLDTKLHMAHHHLQSDTGDSEFTSYHRVLKRGLYKGGNAPAPEPPTGIDSK